MAVTTAGVTSENCPPGYALESFNENAIDRSGIEIEHFERENQIKLIQQAIGVEADGKWGAETNSRFTEWLRVQQAEHMGENEADGWVGKKTIAGLEDHLDPSVHAAIKNLHEDGSLSKLHFRNQMHNAKLIKTDDNSCKVEGGALSPAQVIPEPPAEATPETPVDANTIKPNDNISPAAVAAAPVTPEPAEPAAVAAAPVAPELVEPAAGDTAPTVPSNEAPAQPARVAPAQPSAPSPEDAPQAPAAPEQKIDGDAISSACKDVELSIIGLYTQRNFDDITERRDIIDDASDMVKKAENGNYQSAVTQAKTLLDNAQNQVNQKQLDFVTENFDRFAFDEFKDGEIKTPEQALKAMQDPETRQEIDQHLTSHGPRAHLRSDIQQFFNPLERNRNALKQEQERLALIAAQNNLALATPTQDSAAQSAEQGSHTITSADAGPETPPGLLDGSLGELQAKVDTLDKQQQDTFQELLRTGMLPEGTTFDDLRDENKFNQLLRQGQQKTVDILNSNEETDPNQTPAHMDSFYYTQLLERFRRDEVSRDALELHISQMIAVESLTISSADAPKTEPGVARYAGTTMRVVTDPRDHTASTMIHHVIDQSGKSFTKEQLEKIYDQAGTTNTSAENMASPEEIADFFLETYARDKSGKSYLSPEREQEIRASIIKYESIEVTEDEIRAYQEAGRSQTMDMHRSVLQMSNPKMEAGDIDRRLEKVMGSVGPAATVSRQVAEIKIRNQRFREMYPGEKSPNELTDFKHAEGIPMRRYLADRGMVLTGAIAKKMVDKMPGKDSELTISDAPAAASAARGHTITPAAEPEAKPAEPQAKPYVEPPLDGKSVLNALAHKADINQNSTMSFKDSLEAVLTMRKSDVENYSLDADELAKLEANGIDVNKKYDLSNPEDVKNLLQNIEAGYEGIKASEISPERQAQLDSAAGKFSYEPPKVDYFDPQMASSYLRATVIRAGDSKLNLEEGITALKSMSDEGEFGYDLKAEDLEILARHGIDPSKTYDLSNPEEFNALLKDLVTYTTDQDISRLPESDQNAIKQAANEQAGLVKESTIPKEEPAGPATGEQAPESTDPDEPGVAFYTEGLNGEKLAVPESPPAPQETGQNKSEISAANSVNEPLSADVASASSGGLKGLFNIVASWLKGDDTTPAASTDNKAPKLEEDGEVQRIASNTPPPAAP
jgi:hypothetical protein